MERLVGQKEKLFILFNGHLFFDRFSVVHLNRSFFEERSLKSNLYGIFFKKRPFKECGSKHILHRVLFRNRPLDDIVSIYRAASVKRKEVT